MRVAMVLFALLVVAPALGCRNGDGSNAPAKQTFEAALEEARQTPVDEPMRSYARQLCDPMRDFLTVMADTFNRFDETPEGTPAEDEDEAAIATFFGAFGALREPLEDFREELEDIDPPSELEAAHQTLIGQIDDAIEGLDAFSEGEFFDDGSTPEPTAEEPPGFESALIQECGEDFIDIVEEFGGDFFGSDDETPEPFP